MCFIPYYACLILTNPNRITIPYLSSHIPNDYVPHTLLLEWIWALEMGLAEKGQVWPGRREKTTFYQYKTNSPMNR
ncbi:hypothetical protein CR513_17861, partial [Mucuna pruriens]